VLMTLARSCRDHEHVAASYVDRAGNATERRLEPYQLVTTGFSNSDFGAYGLAVLGAGTVAAVPEPPVILLMLGGMLALCGRRLRAGSRRV